MHVLNQAVRQDGLTSSEAATEHDVEVTADTALDLQSKVFEIPVAVSQALQDLDLVVRPLKPVGTDAVLPRLQDSLPKSRTGWLYNQPVPYLEFPRRFRYYVQNSLPAIRSISLCCR